MLKGNVIKLVFQGSISSTFAPNVFCLQNAKSFVVNGILSTALTFADQFIILANFSMEILCYDADEINWHFLAESCAPENHCLV